jgi:hypothetical protein
VGTGRKHHEIQKGNYRVEERLNQPKQKGASGGIQIKEGTHEQHRHVTEKMPSKCLFCGVSLTTGHIL